ncbi:MAG: hypothetical protein GQ564_16620 [Bacteroidales bacterium]|nr:hypothetical protein [Bacteroidales bacterium]
MNKLILFGRSPKLLMEKTRIYRKDSADAWIQRDKYGTEEKMGWAIDHIFPESFGGDEKDINLQALQWENNRAKSNNFLDFKTSVDSIGKSYLKKEQYWALEDNSIGLLKQHYPENKHLKSL